MFIMYVKGKEEQKEPETTQKKRRRKTLYGGRVTDEVLDTETLGTPFLGMCGLL